MLEVESVFMYLTIYVSNKQGLSQWGVEEEKNTRKFDYWIGVQF